MSVDVCPGAFSYFYVGYIYGLKVHILKLSYDVTLKKKSTSCGFSWADYSVLKNVFDVV